MEIPGIRTIDVSRSVHGAHEAQRSGHANEISTTKYTLITWLPLSFMMQFRRIANVYFLVISGLMIIGTYFPWIFVSPLEPLSTIVTLIVVMLVTSLKEGADDLARYRSDTEENEAIVCLTVYDQSADKWVEKRVHSKAVQPGDIIKLTGKCRVPADMVLLMTSNAAESNNCYVETSNIDGETNLKVKTAPEKASAIIREYSGEAPPLALFNTKVEFEEPNKSIYTFVGALHFDDDSCPLGAENLLLRSSVFSNTDWAYGVALYTGRESKIQMNNSLPPAKMSSFEKYANKAIVGVFVAQTLMVLTVIVSFYALGFDDFRAKLPYVYPDGASSTVLPVWLEQIIIYYILYNNFIPISLYVTMELSNLGQADLIRYDLQMYDEDSDKPCVVKSGNLMQELGQISHIFSDKTGTLTRNDMKLVKLVVGTEIVDVTEGLRGVPGSLGSPRGRRQLYDLLECLVVCHTAVKGAEDTAIEGEDDLTAEEQSKRDEAAFAGSFRAESPDELALIIGARPYGCTFDNRTSTTIDITVDGTARQYEVLATNAFNADRKRMSVLLRNVANGSYSLVCKGADSVMLPLTKTWDDEAQKALAMLSLSEMARKGLRTLVVGRKEISKAAAEAFVAKFKAAANSMSNREENLAAVAAEMELGLDLAGITAIEDRLQKDVPSVIADLATAGIVLWMLTGDKQETAVNIATSCNLIPAGTHLHYLTHIEDKATYASKLREVYTELFPDEELQYSHLQSKAEKEYVQGSMGKNGQGARAPLTCVEAMVASRAKMEENLLARAAAQAHQQIAEIVLVLDGPSFYFFEEEDEASKYHMLAITKSCRAVVACRLTPSQKAQLVHLVKTESFPKILTLAIGDGANDVPMIQEADVGVGIFGKEGHQAANNSDFAIAEFRFLRRLLLVHGRACYLGLANVCLYCLHKNMVITFTIFWFTFLAGVSGTSPYESWMYTGFNFVLGLPIIFHGILDRDLSQEFCLKFPQSYQTSRDNKVLSILNMLSWFANGLAYAFMISALSYLALYDSYKEYPLYDMGTTVFTSLVLALQGKVIFMSSQWGVPQVLSMAISVGTMYGYFVGTSYLTYVYYEKVVPLYNTGAYWFFSLLSVPVVTVVLVDLLWHSFSLVFAPSAEMLMREIEENTVYSKATGGNLCATVSGICRFGTHTGGARARRAVEDEEGARMKHHYGRPSVDLTSVETMGKENTDDYHSVGVGHSSSRTSSSESENSVFVVDARKE